MFFKIISNKKYKALMNELWFLTAQNKNQHRTIIRLIKENTALKNDVNMLKCMLTNGTDIDFPNSSKGGVKQANRNFNINDILQN